MDFGHRSEGAHGAPRLRLSGAAALAVLLTLVLTLFSSPAAALPARCLDVITGDPIAPMDWSEGVWTLSNNPVPGCVTFPGGVSTGPGSTVEADSVVCDPVPNGWHWNVTVPGPFTLYYDFNGIPPGFTVCGTIFWAEGMSGIRAEVDIPTDWMVCFNVDTGEQIWAGYFSRFYPDGLGFLVFEARRCGNIQLLPTGACCRPDGSCEVTIEAECRPPSIWLGSGTSCDPNPCPQPEGACCLESGECVILTQERCLAAQGTYYGDGVPCVPTPCPPTPTDRTTWGRIKAGHR